MKTMNNFAAQQLSKNQMNEVKGGADCVAYDNGGNKIGSGSFSGHVAGAQVKMRVALAREGWVEGSYTVSCR